VDKDGVPIFKRAREHDFVFMRRVVHNSWNDFYKKPTRPYINPDLFARGRTVYLDATHLNDKLRDLIRKKLENNFSKHMQGWQWELVELEMEPMQAVFKARCRGIFHYFRRTV
jgi:hypothetical protein